MESLLTTGSCTLPTADRPLRLAEFEALFATAVDRVDRQGHIVRMHLSGSDGVVEKVRHLAEREMSCCPFFAFTIAGTDQDLTVEISVPPAHQEVLDDLVQRLRESSG